MEFAHAASDAHIETGGSADSPADGTGAPIDGGILSTVPPSTVHQPTG